MRTFAKKIWHDKRGNSLIIAAAALPLLIGSAGLATDTIQWALWKRQLQRAADSAAIAGVYDRVAAESATTNTPAAVDKDLGLNNSLDSAKFPLVTKTVTYPADAGIQQNQVRVELAVQRPLSFSSMFMANAPLIRTTAQAATVSNEGEFCVLTLQNNSKTGIKATGNASIVMDCGMMTNSDSINNSASGEGSANVTATILAAAGGIQQSSHWNVGDYAPGSPALDDPYASLEPSEEELEICGDPSPALLVNISNTGGEADGGGCYSSLSVNSNRSYTLKNGQYFIDGGNVNIQGTLNLVNATLILTNKDSGDTQPIGSLTMNASGQLNATAPTTGKWSGMAIYQDRRAVDNSPTGNMSSNSPNLINGNSTNTITGAVYFPNQQLTYNGNGTGSATCTQFVAKRIYWSGNTGINSFTANCPGLGISAIQTSLRVRLVA